MVRVWIHWKNKAMVESRKKLLYFFFSFSPLLLFLALKIKYLSIFSVSSSSSFESKSPCRTRGGKENSDIWTTWSLTCHSYVCVYTQGLGTPTTSQHNIFNLEKLAQNVLVLLTGFELQIFGSRARCFTNWATPSPHQKRMHGLAPVCVYVCPSQAVFQKLWSHHHQTWHGDCLKHENASCANCIDLDHSRS